MKKYLMIAMAMVFAFAVATPAFAAKPADVGFDEFGYNRRAHNFVGTCRSWHMGKFGSTVAQAEVYCGIYSNDKLKMKWNAEWDRGNAEGWSDENGYDAWLDNQWNGAFPGGSGEVYHFKTKWIGLPCNDTNERWVEGGACIWGQFETLMEHYTDASGHFWLNHAIPSGYGN